MNPYRDELESAQAEAREARQEADDLRKQVREKLWPSRFHYWFMFAVGCASFGGTLAGALTSSYLAGRVEVAERATWNAEWALKERDFTLADTLRKLDAERRLADELKSAVDALVKNIAPRQGGPGLNINATSCSLSFTRVLVVTACVNAHDNSVETCRGDADDCLVALSYAHYIKARSPASFKFATFNEGVTP